MVTIAWCGCCRHLVCAGFEVAAPEGESTFSGTPGSRAAARKEISNLWGP